MDGYLLQKNYVLRILKMRLGIQEEVQITKYALVWIRAITLLISGKM